MDSSMVSAEFGVWLVLPEQMTVPLAARLFYSHEDPYALRIAFEAGLDKPVEWIFARDLLASGIEGREGLGDVTICYRLAGMPGIRPACGHDGRWP